MKGFLALLLVVLLPWMPACAPLEPPADPLPSLLTRQDRPQAALVEHLLAEYFASDVANRPTVCVAIHDGRAEEALEPADELALMERFPALAPMSRCMLGAQGWRDAESGQAALVFTVHNWACPAADRCSGWGGYRAGAAASPSRFYRMQWDQGAWRITADNRAIAR